MKKAARSTNRIKYFAITAVACIALLLSVVCSFAFNIKPALADDGSEPYFIANEHGLRFVQVAAGEDFAIGLTFDGKLYGWSLRESDSTAVGKAGEATSLGYYYSTVPTPIEYTLVKGPTEGNASWGTDSNPDTTYHSVYNGDRIIQIAATRKTAAFLTAAGLIYTWGKDYPYDLDVSGGYEGISESLRNYLLLRTPDTSLTLGENNTRSVSWSKPYIINYNYYDGSNPDKGLSQIKPSSSNLTEMSLAAGENNYHLVYKKSNKYYSYVWGSLLYTATNNPSSAGGSYDLTDHVKDSSDNSRRRVYEIHQAPAASTVTAVAGGYTVGFNGATLVDGTNVTSLSLKGRNFLTSQDPTVSGTGAACTVVPVSTVGTVQRHYYISLTGDHEYVTNGTSAISYTQTTSGTAYNYTVNGSLLGGAYSAEDSNIIIPSVAGSSSTATTNNGQLYYARQASSATDGDPNIVYSVNQVSDSKTGVFNAYTGNTWDGANYAKIIRNAVSLGNDIGYGISGGKLYAWGDNGCGQSGYYDALNGNDVKSTAKNYLYPQCLVDSNASNPFKDKTFLSVAAGKQVSPDAGNKAFLTSSGTFDVTVNSGNVTGLAFKDAVKNGTAFISGAITQTDTDESGAGSLYVWSDVLKTPREVKFPGTSGENNYYNRFVAVYSGYNHNLFAITRLGKVVTVTIGAGDSDYTVKVLDKFGAALADGRTPDAIANWNVIGEKTGDVMNSAEFTVTYDSDGDGNRVFNGETETVTMYGDDLKFKVEINVAKLGEMTFFIDSALASQTTLKLNGVAAQANAGTSEILPQLYNGERGSFVTQNAIGDVYRILDNVNDGGKDYVSATATLDTAALTPKFEFTSDNGGTADLTAAQQAAMFSWSYVYSAVTGVGIKVSPKQSSREGWVTMTFYVARYDCSRNYVIQNGARASDVAVYYDYKPVSVKFKIENTDAQNVFKPSVGTDPKEDNSNIPLLDPNNPSNRVYSVAVQNISAGVNNFAELLSPTNKTAIASAITAGMKANDAGYPDSSKIAAGDLEYYFGSEDAAKVYYNDIYRYLVIDRDSDYMSVTDVPQSNGIRGISAARKTITVSIDMASYNINRQVSAGVEYNADYLMSRFNNVYGIYGVNVEYDDTTATKVKTVSFNYDVVEFTATGTTGRLINEDGKVSTFRTITTGANDFAAFGLNYDECKEASEYFSSVTGSTGTKRRTSFSNFANVFSQGSLRLNSMYDVSGRTAYGNVGSGRDVIVVPADNSEHQIGDTFTINLSQFFVSSKLNTSYIAFSYNNTKIYDDFQAQFPDELDSEKTVVKLTTSTLEITPTTSHPIYLTLTIQRFMPNGDPFSYSSGSDTLYDEKITVSMSFTNISGISLTPNTQFLTTYNIDKQSIIDIWGSAGAVNGNYAAFSEGTATDFKAKYASKVRITGLQVMGDKVGKDSIIDAVASSNSIITVIPKASGTAVVQFSISILDKSMPVSITFNVSSVTVIKVNKKDQSGNDVTEDMTVSLNGTEYVYISELKTALRTTLGDFNESAQNGSYTILYDDVENDHPAAIYFKKYDPTTGEESDLDDSAYYPPYIKSVMFRDTNNDNSAYIRIEMDDSNVSPGDMSKIYRMHVRFVNGAAGNNYTSYANAVNRGGAILETVFNIESTKKIAVSQSGGMLIVKADVDDPKAQDNVNPRSMWYMIGKNTAATIYIPLEYLFEQAGLLSDNYEIFLVSASESAANYFNYTFVGNNVVITPIYNTPVDGEGNQDAITINVSARRTTGSTNTQVISFGLTVDGISTTLPKDTYITIWLVAFFGSLGFLAIIFLIRMIVYWRRRGKQRALIKRNQELIRMRDRIHNRTSAVPRDQVLRTKLRMDDPKYAKLFNEMKKDKENPNGEDGEDGGKKSKKKNSKKSMAELKAELAAKKAAFAQAQGGDMGGYGAQPVNPFGDVPVDGGYAADPGYGGGQGFGGADPGYGMPDQGYGSPADAFTPSDLDGNAIIFDTPDDGSQG